MPMTRHEKEMKRERKPPSVKARGIEGGIGMGVAGGGIGYNAARNAVTKSHKPSVKRKPRKWGPQRLMEALDKGNRPKKRGKISDWNTYLRQTRPTRIRRLLNWEKALIKKHPILAGSAIATGGLIAYGGYKAGKWLGKEENRQWRERFGVGKKKHSSSEPGPNKRQDIAEKSIAVVGTGTGLSALAGLFRPGGPSVREMPEVAQRMAQEMGLRNVPSVHTTPWWYPFFGFNAWFDSGGGPMGRHFNLPSHLRDAVIAHEIGHALNDQALHDIGPGAAIPYNVIQAASRLGTAPMSAIMAVKAARDKDPSYKPGLAALAVGAPMLAEEAAASIRAGSYLVKKHGLSEGLVKSLPLVPAFATYAMLAGAPLAITAIRKHRREKALREQEERRKT